MIEVYTHKDRFFPHMGRAYCLMGEVYSHKGRIFPIWEELIALWVKFIPIRVEFFPIWEELIALWVKFNSISVGFIPTLTQGLQINFNPFKFCFEIQSSRFSIPMYFKIDFDCIHMINVYKSNHIV